MEPETVTINKDTLMLLIDALLGLPFIEVAPLMDRVQAEVGDELVGEPEAPQIVT